MRDGGVEMPPMEEIRVKVCLIGEGEVGKTSLIRRFVYDEFDDHYISTIGAKVSKKAVVVKDGSGSRVTVNMAISDIMGQPTFRDIMKEAFFYGARGVLAVCDVTRRETLSDLRGWVKAVRQVTGDVPIHFLANKVDILTQESLEEGDLAQFVTEYDAPYLYTRAKTGEHVQEAFQELARMMAQ